MESEYLVHPLWFYLYGLLGKLIPAFAIGGIIMTVGSSITYFIAESEGTGNEARTPCRVAFTMGVILLLTAVFLPSQKTALQMVAASYVTTSNVKKGVEIGREIKNEVRDDLIKIIETITTTTKDKQ